MQVRILLSRLSVHREPSIREAQNAGTETKRIIQPRKPINPPAIKNTYPETLLLVVGISMPNTLFDPNCAESKSRLMEDSHESNLCQLRS